MGVLLLNINSVPLEQLFWKNMQLDVGNEPYLSQQITPNLLT